MEIVGLVPLLIESHVDERDLNVIGESPMKLGGRDVRFFVWFCVGKIGKITKKERKNSVFQQGNAVERG
jgi:hypothetical protein